MLFEPETDRMSQNSLHAFEGEKPTPELAHKAGCEIVRVADIDPKQRGRAVRVGDGWRPTTLYRKGRLTRRQYAAACELRRLYEAGYVAPIKGSSWDDRVQSSARPSAPAVRMLDAARDYKRAIAGLHPAQRAGLVEVVIRGAGMGDALNAVGVGDACWMGSGRSERFAIMLALVATGLDLAADRLCL